MKGIIFSSIFFPFCCSLAAIHICGQQTAGDREISSLIRIEYFDWYAQREAGEPLAVKNPYRRGQPEGAAANFPPSETFSRTKAPEKFIYRIRIRNLGEREIASVVWRYEFVNPLTKELAASLEFESRARIKPQRRKTLYAESFSPPVQIVDVTLLLLNKKQPFPESAAVRLLRFDESPSRFRRRLNRPQ